MDKIYIKKLHPDAKIPNRSYPNDAGLDIFTIEDIVIEKGEQKLINTGISMIIPSGYVALVRDKSSIANRGIKSMAGVIDADYRGEYRIMLRNHGDVDIYFTKGDKIAQILIQKIDFFEFEEVSYLKDSLRGDGCFGSTGK